MPWTIEANAQHPVVEVTMSGLIPPPDLARLRSELFTVANRLQRTCLLSDCSDLEGGCTELELLEHAQDVAADPQFCFHKEAVVVPVDPALLREVILWREAAARRGIRVELFQDRRSALAWLLGT